MDLQVRLYVRGGILSKVHSFVAPVALESVTNTSHVIY